MITSPRNPRIARAVRLKKRALRDADRVFLVEGAQAIDGMLRAGITPENVFTTDALEPIAVRAAQAGAVVEEVSDAVMERLTSTVTPQGLVAISHFVDAPLAGLDVADAACVAVVCSGRDPGNAGSVVRSADAAGAGGVIFSRDSVDIYNPKTVRSTAGSLFHLPVVRSAEPAEAVAHLREGGARIFAATAGEGTDLFDADLAGRPAAFLFGNEAWGLAPEVEALADERIRIPIAGGAESLNLAAAAAICLFEWSRQARGHSDGSSSTRSGDDIARLVASAAHDLRSPVAATRSFASTLLGATLDDDTRRMIIEGIAFDADRMDTIVQQLVDAARLASNSFSWHPEPADLRKLVDDMLAARSLNPEYPDVRTDVAAGEITVDGARVRLALAAMLETAVWWATGDLSLGLDVDGAWLTGEVARAKTQLTQEEAEELFEPRSAGTGGGSKLGLFVTRAAARSVGGDVTISVDDGLRLRVTLPVGGAPSGR